MSVRHGITTAGVTAVSAYGHIINIKRLFIDIGRQSTAYHFIITLRPVVFNILLHAVAVSHKAVGIAEVVVCNIAVVIGIGIIVKRFAVIS